MLSEPEYHCISDLELNSILQSRNRILVSLCLLFMPWYILLTLTIIDLQGIEYI